MKKEKINRGKIKANKRKQKRGHAPSVTTNTAGRVSPGSTEATQAKKEGRRKTSANKRQNRNISKKRQCAGVVVVSNHIVIPF